MKIVRVPVRQRGFSLIEIAIVLVIVGLLLGGLLMPLATQVDQQRIVETKKTMEEVKDALVGFAVLNGFLPCPDTNNDGQENRTAGGGPCVGTSSGAGATTVWHGQLPWVNLGVTDVDGWGRRFTYAVTGVYANNAPAALINLGSVGQIAVNDATGAGFALAIPVVVVSHGGNGLGALTVAGTAMPAPTTANENENTDTDATFVSSTMNGTTAAFYDDITAWVAPPILFNKLIAAGVLP